MSVQICRFYRNIICVIVGFHPVYGGYTVKIVWNLNRTRKWGIFPGKKCGSGRTRLNANIWNRNVFILAYTSLQFLWHSGIVTAKTYFLRSGSSSVSVYEHFFIIGTGSVFTTLYLTQYTPYTAIVAASLSIKVDSNKAWQWYSPASDSVIWANTSSIEDVIRMLSKVTVPEGCVVSSPSTIWTLEIDGLLILATRNKYIFYYFFR